VTIAMPVISEGTGPPACRAFGPIAIAYFQDLTWVDTPRPLFQDLLSETVAR
jgi:hypothetical protein